MASQQVPTASALSALIRAARRFLTAYTFPNVADHDLYDLLSDLRQTVSPQALSKEGDQPSQYLVGGWANRDEILTVLRWLRVQVEDWWRKCTEYLEWRDLPDLPGLKVPDGCFPQTLPQLRTDAPPLRSLFGDEDVGRLRDAIAVLAEELALSGPSPGAVDDAEPALGAVDEERMQVYTSRGWIEASGRILDVVSHLTKSKGAWLKSWQCFGDDPHTNNRVHKLKTPPTIKRHIESDGKKGYRWVDTPKPTRRRKPV